MLFITYFFIVVIMAKNSEIQQLYSQDFTRRYPAPVNQYNIITTIDAFFSEFDPSQIPVIRNNNYCMDQIWNLSSHFTSHPTIDAFSYIAF